MNSLIFIFSLLGFAFDGVDSDLFVIFLEGGEILTGLGELSLFHTFSDIPNRYVKLPRTIQNGARNSYKNLRLYLGGKFEFYGEFSSDSPVDEGALGVHEIELVVQSGPGLGDGGRVGQHADGTLDLGQISAGDDGGGLVVDTDLKCEC